MTFVRKHNQQTNSLTSKGPIAFISDLHLDSNNTHTAALFFHFIKHMTSQLQALYILGDLFEYWIGDDDDTPFHRQVIQALADCAQRGVKVYIMRGNRDILLGKRFAKQAHCELLPDVSIVDLYGGKTILCHGDSLCTDDIGYQHYRRRAHNRFLQYGFLTLPKSVRQRLVNYGRRRSRADQAHKTLDIMDANQQAIEELFETYHADLLIHGHTHRPNLHYFCLKDRYVRRIVLSDWTTHGNVLLCSSNGKQQLYYFDLTGTPL